MVLHFKHMKPGVFILMFATYVERSFLLDLGDGRETGRVMINGLDMGLSGSEPMPSGLLKPVSSMYNLNADKS